MLISTFWQVLTEAIRFAKNRKLKGSKGDWDEYSRSVTINGALVDRFISLHKYPKDVMISFLKTFDKKGDLEVVDFYRGARVLFTTNWVFRLIFVALLVIDRFAFMLQKFSKFSQFQPKRKGLKGKHEKVSVLIEEKNVSDTNIHL